MRPSLSARPRLRAAVAPHGAASSLLRLSSAASRLPSSADMGEWVRRAARSLDERAAPAVMPAAA